MSIEKELKELKELLENGDFEHDKESIKEALKNHKENIAKEKYNQNLKVKSSTFDKIIMGMIGAIVVAVGFTIYLYTQVDHTINNPQYASMETPSIEEKKPEQKEAPKAQNIDPKEQKAQEELAKKLDTLASKQLTFENLPQEIQDQYVSKEVLDKQLEILKNQYQDQLKNIQEETQKLLKNNKNLRSAPQAITFESLPQNIKDKYISKAQYDAKIKELELQLKQKSATASNVAPVVKNTTTATASSEVSPYNFVNEAQNALGNSAQPIEMIRCYDTNANAIEITQTCQNNINDALTKHKDAKYFEIVGVIGESDKKAFNVSDEKALEYLSMGLAQSRANEAAWYIRKKVGNTPTIRPINYPVYSKQDNKGALIKIYK